MSKTSLLMLALVTLAGRCSCEDHDGRRELADGCQQNGTLRLTKNISCDECCKVGQAYPTYKCSPPVTGSTRAIMTLNNFQEGGDGGDSSECDGKFHKNSERIVALSTGWYANGKRCGKNIRINAKGRSVLAEVVDECDSLHGCDRPHAYQPPCRPNVVDASQAVWDALGITGDDVGEYPITWSAGPMLEHSGTSKSTFMRVLCCAVICASIIL